MSYKRSEYIGPSGQYLNPFFPDSKLTADIFWRYFPVEVRALRDTPPLDRFAAAFELLKAGHKIVADVMIYEVDPVTYITLCYNQGYRWVPTMGAPPIPVAPGLSFPGLPSYDPTHPPEKSFPISLDPADYPAYDPTPPSVPAEPPMIIGNYMGGGFWGQGPAASAATVQQGQTYTAPNGKKVKAVIYGSGGAGIGIGSFHCYFQEI